MGLNEAVIETDINITPKSNANFNWNANEGHNAEKSQASPRTPGAPRNNNIGARVGPYILGKTLGVGSTGRVKAGTHIETMQKVAIKIINKDPNLKKADKKMEREITIMKLIQHPNVLQIYDVYEGAKELYLVLEQVEGGELFDYLVKRGRLKEKEALRFFQQIISGVEYCHKHLICHRDLKPENLLLDKDFNVKIADFGMANMQAPEQMLETSCGSPHYASPEIIRGVKYDGPTSDVWSCGIILYALLTGNLPFDDENIRKLLNKVKTGLFHIPSHVSSQPKELIERMLTVEPSLRITLPDVMLHPWYLSKDPTRGAMAIPTLSPFESTAIEEGFPESYEFELDLLEALTFLGWTNRPALTAALRAKKNNPEKVFYNLLHQRKWEQLENYNDGKTYDQEGGPHRRADSYDIMNANSKGKSNNTSPYFDGDADTPKPHVSSSNFKSGATSKLQTDITPQNMSGESSSPISPQIQESSTLEKQKLAASPSPKPKAKLLVINTEKISDEGGGPLSASMKSALGQSLLGGAITRKLHLKGILLDMIPSSPIISAAPKESWFKGVLNFKPEMYYLISEEDMNETVLKMERILTKLDVQFKVVSKGLFKCKLKQDGSFKIEIVAYDDKGSKLRVQMIHKQGAFSLFQTVVQTIQSEWAV